MVSCATAVCDVIIAILKMLKLCGSFTWCVVECHEDDELCDSCVGDDSTHVGIPCSMAAWVQLDT